MSTAAQSLPYQPIEASPENVYIGPVPQQVDASVAPAQNPPTTIVTGQPIPGPGAGQAPQGFYPQNGFYAGPVPDPNGQQIPQMGAPMQFAPGPNGPQGGPPPMMYQPMPMLQNQPNMVHEARLADERRRRNNKMAIGCCCLWFCVPFLIFIIKMCFVLCIVGASAASGPNYRWEEWYRSWLELEGRY